MKKYAKSVAKEYFAFASAIITFKMQEKILPVGVGAGIILFPILIILFLFVVVCVWMADTLNKKNYEPQ